MTGSVRVTVTPAQVQAVPGTTTSLAVRVVNGSSIVDEFAIEVVGGVAAWASVDRPRVSLLPDREETVELTLSPPLQAPPRAGPVTAGVRVASVTQPEVAWVEELPLVVAPVSSGSLTLTPQQVKGGGSARLRAQVDNGGNVPLQLSLRGDDPEEAVRFTFEPQQVDVPPGGRTTAKVHVAGPRAWSGPEVSRPLTVHAEGAAEPLVAKATFVQRSRIAGGLVKAVAGLAAAAMVGLAIFAANLLVGGDAEPLAHEDTGADEDVVDDLGAPLDEEVANEEDEGDEGEAADAPFLVPDVTDRPEADALSALETGCPPGAPCLSVLLIRHFDTAVPSGRALGTDPAAGTSVNRGDEVTLMVSLGDRPPLAPNGMFRGVWEDPADQLPDGALTRVVVAQDGATVIVQAWERCGTDDCDRGVEFGTVQDGVATVAWDHRSLERTVELSRVGGALRVVAETQYSDGRPPEHRDETFTASPTGPGDFDMTS